MEAKSVLLGVIVFYCLLSLVECQQRPLKPTQFYTHTTTVYSYETYKSEVAYDSTRDRFMRKDHVGESIGDGTFEVSLDLPLTSFFYANYEYEECFLYCCNGVQEVSSTSWIGWSSSTWWYWVSSSTWSSWSSWSSWSTWDAKEESSEIEELEFVETTEPIRRDVPSARAAKLEALGMKVMNPITLKKAAIQFSYERKCEGATEPPFSVFDDLPRTRYTSLCSFQGQTGNLWSYSDPYGTTVQYCMQSNGNPLYVKYSDNWDEDSYVYFDTYTTQVTEDDFVIPDACGCVVDWAIN